MKQHKLSKKRFDNKYPARKNVHVLLHSNFTFRTQSKEITREREEIFTKILIAALL